MVMRSPVAGHALDPPSWKILKKALSLSLSLSLSEADIPGRLRSKVFIKLTNIFPKELSLIRQRELRLQPPSCCLLLLSSFAQLLTGVQ